MHRQWRRSVQFIVFIHSYLRHVRAGVKRGPGQAYSVWPFSRSLRHVITPLLTFTAVKHVSSPNHNKDNRGSALRSIAQQVDICVCVCWHYSWAVIWSEWWSKCLWWLGVICFPGLWSMVCSWIGRVCVRVCVCKHVQQNEFKQAEITSTTEGYVASTEFLFK